MADRRKRSKGRTQYAEDYIPETCENLKLVFSSDGKLQIFIGQSGVYNYCLDVIRIWEVSDDHAIIVLKQIGIEPRTILWSKIVPGDNETMYFDYLDDILEKNKFSITTVEMDFKKLLGHAAADDDGNDSDGERPMPRVSFEPIEKKIRMGKVTKLNKIVAHTSKDLVRAKVLDISQIMGADHVELPGTNLSFRQVLRFEGTYLSIKSDGFVTNNIRQYLRYWMNGHVNIEYLDVKMRTLRGLEPFRVINGFAVNNFINSNDKYSFQLSSSSSTRETMYCEVTCTARKFTFEKIPRDIIV